MCLPVKRESCFHPVLLEGSSWDPRLCVHFHHNVSFHGIILASASFVGCWVSIGSGYDFWAAAQIRRRTKIERGRNFLL
eukprot:12337227-Alexandrium_andersonii.AAC.1